MRIFLPLLIIFIFQHCNVHAQVVIIDEGRNPIPYVDIIISNTGSIFWQTDKNGAIPLHVLKSAQKTDTLKLHHISFKDKEILMKNLNRVDTILLIPHQYELKEVEIYSKNPRYQTISACFRSVRFKNGHPIYYTDGEIEYLTKTKSLDYKVAVGEHRAFENKNIEKFLDPYKVSIPMGTATVPLLEEKYLPFYLKEKYNLEFNKTDSGLIEIRTEEDSIIGTIRELGEIIDFKINLDFTLKSHKALNTRVNESDFHLHMIFKTYLQDDQENFKDFDNLLYFKQIYNYTVKHDKDTEEAKIETVEEIFVQYVQFLQVPNTEYTRARGMPKDSKYSREFWKSCDCEVYYPPSQEFFEVMNMR